MTNFNFSKSDFILSQLDADVVVQEKIQETSTIKLVKCLQRYFTSDFKLIKNPSEYLSENCSLKNLDNIFQELYKRFFIPFYIPALILSALLLIIKSKESLSYNKFKISIFYLASLLLLFQKVY